MTSRNFGINSGRAGPSGASGTGTSARASTPRDTNLSDGELDFFTDDRDFGALVFAFAAFTSPFVIVGMFLIVLSVLWS